MTIVNERGEERKEMERVGAREVKEKAARKEMAREDAATAKAEINANSKAEAQAAAKAEKTSEAQRVQRAARHSYKMAGLKLLNNCVYFEAAQRGYLAYLQSFTTSHIASPQRRYLIIWF